MPGKARSLVTVGDMFWRDMLDGKFSRFPERVLVDAKTTLGALLGMKEVVDESMQDDNRPSCSVRVSLTSQGLFVNDVAMRFAAQLLYELFSRGGISEHGVVVNPGSKRSGPIEVDPRTWQRFGHVEANEEEGIHVDRRRGFDGIDDGT